MHDLRCRAVKLGVCTFPTYAYDATGNRTKMVTPYATTAYTYDAKNRLTTIDDSVLLTFRLAYDAMDRRTSLVYPNGLTTSYAYDKAYRLTALVSKDNQGNVVDAWSYQYDAVGNRTSKTDMNGASEIYTYDNVYRLTSANYGNSNESFTYDPVGNRLTRTADGSTTTYSYDIANELKTAGSDVQTYDANGNVTKKTTSSGTTTVAYNLRNLPTSIATPGGNETNTYGPNGERVTMAGASIENRTVAVQYDLAGNPIADHDLSGTAAVWTYRLYGPGIDECLGEYRRNNNRKTYQLHDALGSVTAVANDAGQVAYRSTYKAFGDMSRTADSTGIPTTRLGFTSRETSVGGLMQYRSRYYDPGYGRFLQQDAYEGAVDTPPSLDRYVYCVNSPVRYLDPDGHDPQDEMQLGTTYGGDTDILQFILLAGFIFAGLVAMLSMLWPLIVRSITTFATYVLDILLWLRVTVDFLWLWLTTVTWPSLLNIFITGYWAGWQLVYAISSGKGKTLIEFLAHAYLYCNGANEWSPENTGPPTTLPIPVSGPGAYVLGCMFGKILFRYFAYLL